jgi:hypothetical protein
MGIMGVPASSRLLKAKGNLVARLWGNRVLIDNYTMSLGNLAERLAAFDRAHVYDNGGREPRLVLEVRNGHVKTVHSPLPQWVRGALAGTVLGIELDRETTL